MPVEFLRALGAAFVVMGVIFSVIGVFAWLRHAWAIIVGAVIAVAMAATPSASGEPDYFGIGVAVVFAALAIVALTAGWRVRAAKAA